MVAAIAGRLALALVGLVGEPASAVAEFGTLYEFVLVLCALNTLGVLYFAWRVFRERPAEPDRNPVRR